MTAERSLVFRESSIDIMISDVEKAASDLRDVQSTMSSDVELNLLGWFKDMESRQAQQDCAKRLDQRAEQLFAVLDSLKEQLEVIRAAGLDAEIKAFAAVD